MAPAALELRAIVKRYGNALALDGVDFDARPGEIHALCGENGAGKSTLARIAAGVLGPTAGTIVRKGRVGLVHQHFELVRRLRVWENVALGYEPRRGARVDRDAARERVRALGRRYGLTADPDAIVESLPIGLAQRVEILRELAREPAVLVLDEPTAVLAPQEIDALFATLRALAAGGATIVVVTHKLGEVAAYADWVTVLRAGRVVASDAMPQTSPAAIARAMIGGTVPAVAKRTERRPQSLFEARDIATADGTLGPVSFAVGAGEIVALAGVEGNGQTHLVDAVAGTLVATGTMHLDGALLAPGDPARRIAAGIRTIPQDREREALVLPWTVAENIALGDHARPPLRRGIFVDVRAREARAQTIVAEFDVRAPGPRAPVATLSGGNQQKLVVGRALTCAPRLVVAYQPTRGIDVGAAALVRSRLIEARNEGVGILLVSFELDEIFALADVVLVLFRGACAGRFTRAQFDRERIGAAMTGAS